MEIAVRDGPWHEADRGGYYGGWADAPPRLVRGSFPGSAMFTTAGPRLAAERFVQLAGLVVVVVGLLALLGWALDLASLSGLAPVLLLAAATLSLFAARLGWHAAALDRVDRERRWAEGELKAERFLLHSLLDHVPDSIYYKDEQSRF